MEYAIAAEIDRKQTDPAEWNEQYGECLFRYAMKHVGDPHKAQDLVQETWLAAWQSRERFAGQSTERTWLIGILRHKVLDHFRADRREQPLSDLQHRRLSETGSLDTAGWPAALTPAWMNPSSQVERKQLWTLLDQCLFRMTDRLKAVFASCDLNEVPHREVARRLGVTEGHLYVRLHRAREKVREYLSV